MKKITEKQLLEATGALREYLKLTEAEYSQAAPPSLGAAIKKQGADWWKTLSGEGKPLFPETPNISGVSGQPEISGNPTIATSTQPKPSVQVKPSEWPSTRQEIIDFQKKHKDAAGKSLIPDGSIGKRTLEALKKAGFQPPPGFKPVPDKKPMVAKPKQSTQPDYQAAFDQEFGQNYTKNANADMERLLAAMRDPAAIKSQASVGNIPGLGGIPSGTVPAINKEPGPQTYGLGTEKPTNFAGKEITNEEIDRILNLSGLSEAGLGSLIKGAKAFGRGLINRTNPQIREPGGKFQPITDIEKSSNRLGRDINKNAATTTLGIGGTAAGLSGGIETGGEYKTPGINASSQVDTNELPDTSSIVKKQGTIDTTSSKISSNDVKSPVTTKPLMSKPVGDEEIRNWQRNLNDMGYNAGTSGRWDDKTAAAFQQYMTDQPVNEHVSFSQMDSLARIVELARK